MKISLTHLRLFAALLCLLGMRQHNKAQCLVNFTTNIGAAGNVTFTSLSTNTNVNTTYTWTFGNSVVITGSTNAVSVVNNYSVNGTYTVVLSVNNGTCSGTATQTLIINNAPNPTCSLQIAYTAPTGTNCNGTATVTGITGLCNIPFYSWSNGANTATTGGLCAGSVYTVTVISASGGSCCSTITGTVSIPGCPLAVSVVTASPGGTTVNFASTTTGTLASSSYSWNFGDSSPIGGGNPTSHIYSNFGNYNGQLKVYNNGPGGCVDSVYFSVNLGCNITSGFTYTTTGQGPGVVLFGNNSTNTGTSTVYVWNFGNGGPTQTVTSQQIVTHTYSANGTYTVGLAALNSGTPACGDTLWQVITVTTVPVPCGLVANFTPSVYPGGIVVFMNTSTGTTTNTSYAWTFAGATNSLSSAQNPTVTYAGTGTYGVLLQVSNNSSPTCTASVSGSVSIPCMLNAGFSHTLGASGQATFQSTSTGTTASTNYVWNFGDGVSNSGNPIVHSYASSGAYNVTLKASFGSCKDTLVQSVNVTGLPCVANSGFTLVPQGTPQYWDGIPASPWNVVSATWDWGDGSASNTLYAAHAYSVAGNYNICLSVTVSCASTASSCSSYSVYRTQQAMSQKMVYVNIIKPGLSTSIADPSAVKTGFDVYPNPNNGHFSVKLSGFKPGPALTQVYNLAGELVYEKSNEEAGNELADEIYLGDVSTGLYLIRIRSGEQVLTKKILISAP